MSTLGQKAQFTDVTTPLLANPDYSEGAAWGDFDGDGDLDLAVPNSLWGGKGNRLFRNDGNGTFSDATPPSMAAMFADTVAWADYNNDGRLDLFFASRGREGEGGVSSLFRNDGGGVFTNVADGLLRAYYSGVAWGDYDGDGYVDMYLSKEAATLRLSPNFLMRNLGVEDRFADTTTSPIHEPLAAGVPLWGDYDNDGDLDLFVANSGSSQAPSKLFRNDGGGAFTDVTTDLVGRCRYATTWMDFDDDGDLDLSGEERLLRNDGGTFVDVTSSILPGVSGNIGRWAWGDYDNDGDLDALVTAGTIRLFRNDGNSPFVDVTPVGLANVWLSSTGPGWGDYDNDGDLDFFISAWMGGGKHLYRNDLSNGNHWLHLDLQGGPSNRSAIGARVTLMTGGRTQFREVASNGSNKDSLTVEFGLGTNTLIDSVLIRWPSGTLQTMTGIGVDQHLRITESAPTNTPPVLTSQPVGRNVYAGEPVRLALIAFGSWPLTYQWSKDSANIVGATNSTLFLSNVTVAAAGDYTVVVSNEFGSVTSAVAKVTVTERSWPYSADFEGVVGQEWSNRKTDVTPKGNRKFLGQFGNDTVSLTLNGLPAHREVTVSFDLYIIDSWDGNAGDPDIWELGVANGPTLLHTTFANWPDSPPQAYPGTYPGDQYPHRASAVETDSLGFIYEGMPLDTVYHLFFTVPHTGNSVTFNFSGRGLEDLWNESWGLDNVRMELTPADNLPYVQTELESTGIWSFTNNLPVSGISVSGNQALARLGDSEVRLLDIKNPAAPVELGAWSTLLPLSDAVLVGNLAYLASWEPDFLSTVEIVDFTDPAKPLLKGYFDTPGYAMDVTVRGNMAYVADAEGGMLIFDVGDPVWPRRLGGYDTKGSVEHLEVYGRYAFIPDGNWLVILDVGDPANPRRVGLYEVTGGISCMKAYGTKLYLSEASGALRVLEVSNPAKIEILSTYQGWGGPAKGMAVSGKYLYLAKGNGGLQVLDVNDPAKPVYLTGEWKTPAGDVALTTGNYAWVAAGDKGLDIFQLQQSLYPPLKPPVISNGMMTLTWVTTNDVRLQKCTNLVNAVWVHVPESEGTNMLTMPMTEEKMFFRLVQAPKQGQLPQGLVGWWSLDGNANDISGGRHDGLPVAVNWTSDGLVAGSGLFDGISSRVSVPASPELNLSYLTVAAWVKLNRYTGDHQVVLAKWYDNDAWSISYVFEFQPNSSILQLGLNDVGYVEATSQIPLSEWTFIVGTYDGMTASLYIDGVEAASRSAPGVILPSTSPVIIGAHDSVGDRNPLDGGIDEVMLFDRALTDAEIKAIYDAGSAGKIKPTP